MLHLGTVPASSTLYIPFATYDSNDPSASVTCTGLAVTDIEIYKNGSTTQRASDAGFTLLDTDGIDFDGITGLHGFSIDLSDNTDAGFYAVGSFYWVVVSSITVDAATINFVAATFRIGPAEAQTGYQKVDADYVEGTDATDQIRDAVVDDATRIDASALNTASAAVGSDGTGLTEAGGTGDHLTALATQAKQDTIDTVVDAIKLVTDNLPDSGALTTLLNNVSAILTDTGTTLEARFTGITSLAEWLGLLAGKQAGNATALTEIKATGAGAGTYDPTTDSNEALRDTAPMGTAMRGTDSASTHDAAAVKTALEAAGSHLALILEDTGTSIPALIAALNNLSAADVNAQVADVLKTDTIAELAADPGATPTIEKALMLLYMALRNKVDIDKTAATKEVHNNAGAVVGTKALSDDDTTYSEAKMTF